MWSRFHTKKKLPGEQGKAPEPTSLGDLNLENTTRFFEKRVNEFGLESYLPSLIDIDLSSIVGPAKRINITIPEFALAKIDAAASSVGKSRSEFLTDAGLRAS